MSLSKTFPSHFLKTLYMLCIECRIYEDMRCRFHPVSLQDVWTTIYQDPVPTQYCSDRRRSDRPVAERVPVRAFVADSDSWKGHRCVEVEIHVNVLRVR